jgi:DNA-binding MarR family transcriptional regulator
MPAAKELFFQMYDVYRSRVPSRLAKQDLHALVKLMAICENRDCISQAAAMDELGLRQSQLNKLAHKLKDAKWLSIRKSSKDRRVAELKLTPAGAKWLSQLRNELARCMVQTLPTPVLTQKELMKDSDSSNRKSRGAKRIKEPKVSAPKSGLLWDEGLASQQS